MKPGVLDTSTLQALHRGGALACLPSLFPSLHLPLQVAQQNAAYAEQAPPDRAPDLATLPRIGACVVEDSELVGLMPRLFAAHARRSGWDAPLEDVPVVWGNGHIVAGQPPKRVLTHKVTELAIIALALRLDGVAIVDDRRVIRGCQDLGIPTISTREVLAEAERRELIPSRDEALRRIEATGYIPMRRMPGKWPG